MDALIQVPEDAHPSSHRKTSFHQAKAATLDSRAISGIVDQFQSV
jgi:hypothetical protein